MRGRLGKRLSRFFAPRPALPETGLPPRPATRLVWLHCGAGLMRGARDDLVTALLGAGKTTVLLTGDAQDLPEPARPRVMVQPLPDDAHAVAFFEHFHPNALLWSGAIVHPRLLARLAHAGIPAALFNIAAADLSLRRQRRHLAELAVGFSDVFCADSGVFAQLQGLGTTAPRLFLTGPMFPMVSLPTDDTARRKTMSQKLEGRPVWAALGVCPAHLAFLAEAQIHARRAAPGLIMLVVPAAGHKSAAIAAELLVRGVQAAALDAASILPGALVFEPTATPLVARLAPVAVIADSLAAPGAMITPLVPASLGAALIHGTFFGDHAEDFGRLVAADASCLLATRGDLNAALVALLRPDTAAAMATAAWATLSAGAETIDALSALAVQGAD